MPIISSAVMPSRRRRSVMISGLSFIAATTTMFVPGAHADDQLDVCAAEYVTDSVCRVQLANMRFPSDIFIEIPADYPHQQQLLDAVTQLVTDYQKSLPAIKIDTGQRSTLTIRALDYSAGTPTPRSRSVILQSAVISADEEPTTKVSYRAFNFDTADGGDINASDLFTPNSAPERLLPRWSTTV